jgi:hypothetical protein
MKTKSSRLNLSLVTTSIASLTLLAQTATAQQWTTNTLPPGLIAWWQAEGNYLDSAGVHHGGGSTAPTYAPGRFGQAFQFNGTDQSVSIPDLHSDLDSWTQFTLEAWVYFDFTADPPVHPPGRCMLSKVGGPDGNFGYQFGFYDNARRLFVQFNTNGQAWATYSATAIFAEPMPTHVWLHTAATYDHDTIKLYLNGALVKTNQIGPVTLANSASSLRISKDDNLNVPFPGRIDDARIYNRALSAAEIAYLYQGPTPPVTQGLKFHLDANDANGDGTRPAEGSAVTTWRDLSGLGLDATPLFGVAPVYRTNALNGRAGVDFSQSGSDALATAFTHQLNFTNCTILMVANGAGSPTHVSISAPCVTQEFMVGDQFICHHSAPFKWSKRFHHNSPVGYYLQAGLFGTSSNELANCINGVFSTNRLSYSWEQGQQSSVTDYTPVSRHAILGWRNTDAYCHVPPYGPENFNGVICEVLVYDRQLTPAEVDAVNFFLSAKYGLPVTPIPPVLRVAAVTSGIVGLQWPSTSGRRYQLQSATNLPAASWAAEGPPFPGTGGVLATNLPIGSGPAKFFRLQLSN